MVTTKNKLIIKENKKATKQEGTATSKKLSRKNNPEENCSFTACLPEDGSSRHKYNCWKSGGAIS